MFYLEQSGSVAFLRHAPGFLTVRALAELRRLVFRLEKDDTVRVIVVSAGILHTQIDEIAAMLALTARMPLFLLPLLRLWVWLVRRFPSLAGEAAPLNVLVGFDALQRSRKVTIAAIDAPCIGGGFELSLCCDYRLASDEGVLGCPEVRMGLMPGFGGSQRLAQLIGNSRTRQLLLSGELLTPSQAAQLGIVSLVRSANFDDEVRRFAADMAQRPPLAVAGIKRALADDVWGRLWVELREVARLARTQDVALGLAEYRRALADSDDPVELLSRMREVTFSGR